MFLVTELNLTQSHVAVTCQQCGHVYSFIATTQGLRNYQNGELVQVALPELASFQRELLISGICGDCEVRTCGAHETNT